MPLSSRSPVAARTRWLVGIVATRDLGQTYASVAEQLGVHTGSLFNLLERPRNEQCTELMLAEVRRRHACG